MTLKQFEQYRFGIKTHVLIEDPYTTWSTWFPIVYVDFEDNGVGVSDEVMGLQRFIYHEQIKDLRD